MDFVFLCHTLARRRHRGVKHCSGAFGRSVNAHSLPVKSLRSHFIGLWLSAPGTNANTGTGDAAEIFLLGDLCRCSLSVNTFYGNRQTDREEARQGAVTKDVM